MHFKRPAYVLHDLLMTFHWPCADLLLAVVVTLHLPCRSANSRSVEDGGISNALRAQEVRNY